MIEPVLPSHSAALAALQHLITVVAQLRDPNGGCPWDLAQTPETLIPFVLEEAYETADAIRQGETAAIADELGDLLLQVVLQAQIGSESQQFDLATVAEGIAAKLIRRHPHVFGTAQAETVEQVRQNWEEIKAEEEQTKTALLSPRLERYARSLPPLTAAMKISKKVAEVGFEWDSVAGVWEKFHEELGEFEQALAAETKAEQQAELGDLLFTIVNLARWYGLDPEAALQGTNQRFVQRFSHVEQSLAGRALSDYSLEELEQFWQAAKRLQQS
jgi:XTP/dITP diphosphohydrolase